MDRVFAERGFLPAEDPLVAFPYGSPLSVLDEIGRDLPSLLEDEHFREHARGLTLPPCPDDSGTPDYLRQLHLYYVRVGFLASAYVNQSRSRGRRCCRRTSRCRSARSATLLRRPPILSYDGYALYNWKRFDPAKPIALGNIDTFQNFVHLYDEHWFILVHVEIEAIAARILAAIERVRIGVGWRSRRCGERRARRDRGGAARAGRGAAPDSGEDGPGAVLPDLPAVHPLLRERRLRGRVRSGR